MDNERPGYVLTARKIIDSEIWQKPSSWYKLWHYILMEVNFETKRFPRGTGLFRWQTINQIMPDITEHMWHHFISWAKQATQIATQKTTRGIIITVVNYEQYQNPKFYKSDTKSYSESQIKATQKRHRSDMIPKEGKEGNTLNLAAQPPEVKKKDSWDTDKYPKADYKQILDSYQTIKGTKLQGDEFLPPMREVKMMFRAGRSVSQIIQAMEVCNDNYEDWAMSTVRMKIADIVSGKLRSKGGSRPAKLIINSVNRI